MENTDEREGKQKLSLVLLEKTPAKIYMIIS